MTLAGKVAIVTGASSGIASSGIGEATARLLAHSGCNAVLAARREDRLDAVAAEFGERGLCTKSRGCTKSPFVGSS